MLLLSRLEYERSFGARWVTYFVRIPNECVYRTNHYTAVKLVEAAAATLFMTITSLPQDTERNRLILAQGMTLLTR